MAAGGMGMNTGGMPSRATAPGPIGGGATLTSTGFMTPSVGGGMNQGIAAGGAGGFPSTGASMMSGGVSVTPSQPGEQLRPGMFNPAAGGGHLQPMQQQIQQPVREH